jgi:hypothetical protein
MNPEIFQSSGVAERFIYSLGRGIDRMDSLLAFHGGDSFGG